uniref:Uncharacterized protein MANES_16G095100 n=1 Tax=Rhizophora mucronata TaxID=61149 RepID=A0A2P2L5B7_RHIMU
MARVPKAQTGSSSKLFCHQEGQLQTYR